MQKFLDKFNKANLKVIIATIKDELATTNAKKYKYQQLLKNLDNELDILQQAQTSLETSDKVSQYKKNLLQSIKLQDKLSESLTPPAKHKIRQELKELKSANHDLKTQDNDCKNYHLTLLQKKAKKERIKIVSSRLSKVIKYENELKKDYKTAQELQKNNGKEL